LFRKLKAGRQSEVPDRAIEPRLNQIFLPLLSVVSNPKDREELRALARRYHGEMVNERGMDLGAQVLEVIRALRDSGRPLAIKDIASWLIASARVHRIDPAARIRLRFCLRTYCGTLGSSRR
jgi:hypothetical protein